MLEIDFFHVVFRNVQETRLFGVFDKVKFLSIYVSSIDIASLYVFRFVFVGN